MAEQPEQNEQTEQHEQPEPEPDTFKKKMERKADFDSLSATMDLLAEVNRNLENNLCKLVEIKNHGNFSEKTKEIMDKQVINPINSTRNTTEELRKILFPLKQILTMRQNSGPDDMRITYDNTSDIWKAILKGNLTAVEFYYNGYPSILKKKNIEGYTPLLWAAKHGENSIINYLLSKEDSLDVFDYEMRSPLLCAAQAGFKRTVELLLDQGVDINYQDKDKNTALHLAILQCKPDIEKLLIERGADQNLKNEQNLTAQDLIWNRTIQTES